MKEQLYSRATLPALFTIVYNLLEGAVSVVMGSAAVLIDRVTFREGKESFDKAKGMNCSCCGNCQSS